MYERYYSMRSKAFPCQPTPAVFYESPIHRGALYYLKSGLEEREPFLLITGEYGMGKTLLALQLEKMMTDLEHDFVDASEPLFSYTELLNRLLRKVGLEPQVDDPAILCATLFEYYRQRAEEHPTLTIVLDEVQDLSIETLARIRMLSNMNIKGHYPFNFIFFSHPSINDLLATPELESLNQRIRRRFHLSPFDLSETKEYIYFRLIESGASGSPYFPDDSIRAIHEKSHGIPRFINNICDAALLIGASNDLDVIGPPIVEEAAEAISALNLAPKEEESPPPAPVLLKPKATRSAPPPDNAQPEPAPPPAEQPSPASEPTARRQGLDFDALQPTDGRPNRPPKATPAFGNVGNFLHRRFLWTAVVILLLIVAILVLRERLDGLQPDTSSQVNKGEFEDRSGYQAVDPTSGLPAEQTTRQSTSNQVNAVEETNGKKDQVDLFSFAQDLWPPEDETETMADRVATGTGNTSMPASTQSPETMPATNPANNVRSSAPPQSEARPMPFEQWSSVRPGDLPTTPTGTGYQSSAPQPAAPLPAPAWNVGNSSPQTMGQQPSQMAPTSALSLGRPTPWSLMLGKTRYGVEAANVQQVRTSEGIPNTYVVKTTAEDGSPEWVIYQGFYPTQAAAENARDQLQLYGASATALPFSLRIQYQPENREQLVDRLKSEGYYTYTTKDGGHANELLLGAYPDDKTALAWQKMLAASGFTATLVRR